MIKSKFALDGDECKFYLLLVKNDISEAEVKISSTQMNNQKMKTFLDMVNIKGVMHVPILVEHFLKFCPGFTGSIIAPNHFQLHFLSGELDSRRGPIIIYDFTGAAKSHFVVHDGFLAYNTDPTNEKWAINRKLGFKVYLNCPIKITYMDIVKGFDSKTLAQMTNGLRPMIVRAEKQNMFGVYRDYIAAGGSGENLVAADHFQGWCDEQGINIEDVTPDEMAFYISIFSPYITPKKDILYAIF